jgi:hypothetical protein
MMGNTHCAGEEILSNILHQENKIPTSVGFSAHSLEPTRRHQEKPAHLRSCERAKGTNPQEMSL